MDGGACYPSAGQFRTGIVGDLPAGQQAGAARDVIPDRDHYRYGWRGHIDHHRIGTRRRADVARRVGGDNGKVVLSLGQHAGWGKAPDPGFPGGHGAQQFAAFVDRHAAVGFGGAGQGWGVVVGAAAAGDSAGDRIGVIQRARNHRRGGDGVDVKRERRGAIALVPGRIGGAEGQGIRAIDQRLRQGKVPGPGVADLHAAEQGVIGVDVNGVARRGVAGERWLSIVGALAVDKRAYDGTDVIHHATENRSVWRGQVDNHRRTRRLAAGLQAIVDAGGGAKAVAAFTQRYENRNCPCAGGGIGKHGTHRGRVAVQVQIHQAARDRRPADDRSGVVGAEAFDVNVFSAVAVDNGEDHRNVRQGWGRRHVKGNRIAGVTGYVAGGHAQGYRIALRRRQGDGELALGIGDAGAQHVAIRGAHGDGGTRLGGAVKRGAAAGDVGNVRCIRRQRINGDVDRCAAAGVARCIAGHRRNAVRGIAQDSALGERQFPLSLIVGLHLPAVVAVNIHRHGAARIAGAADGRQAAVGVQGTVRQGAVGNGKDLRDRRWHGIDVEGKVAARLADVTGGIYRRHGQVGRALFQGGGGDGPVAVDNLGTAHFDPVVVEDHRGARFAAAGDGRGGVVGAAARVDGASDRADIIVHAGDNRDLRYQAVDGDGDALRDLGNVPGLIGGGDGKAVGALIQRGFRTPAPVAVHVDNHFADFFIAPGWGLVVDADHVIRRAGAAQHRTGVVGGAVIADRAGDIADVIYHERDVGPIRGQGIDGDGHRLGRGALVARAVFVADG
ncbi:hypothetical protein D3C75_366320 [compost metagenome]